MQNAIIIQKISKVYPLTSVAGDREAAHEKYALKDFSYNFSAGSITGLIGMNGAGKSTLLKLIAQITPPSDGSINVNGKVLSILEVGIGFIPENTGRDNVLMYGNLMGLSRKRMLEKMPEIVDFSGIGEYIDQPVKFYSSGMYLRLAFSVLIAMDADIFLFDEVLSVGDIAFRNNVLNYIKSLKEKGKTVIIVSHTPTEISRFCDQMILLHHGTLVHAGAPVETIQKLNEIVNGAQSSETRSNQIEAFKKIDNDFIAIDDIALITPLREIQRNRTIEIEIRFNSKTEDILDWTINLQNSWKVAVLSTSTMLNTDCRATTKGKYMLKFTIPAKLLSPGFYSLDAYVTSASVDKKIGIPNVISFQVADTQKEDQCSLIPASIYIDLLKLNREES